MAAQDGSQALERAWLFAVARRDKDAFEALYARFERPVFRYALALLGDRDAAEDVLNDVMLALWNDAGRYRGTARASTWIFSIAHHKAIDRSRRRIAASVPIDSLIDTVDANADPAVHAERAEDALELSAALRALSTEHRAVVELAFSYGYGYREIAEIVRCPIGTVKTRVYHARKLLQAHLDAARKRAYS